MTRYDDNDNDNQHTTTNNHSKKAHALLNDPAKFAIALVIRAAEILVARLKVQLDEVTVNLEQADPARQDYSAARSSKRHRAEGRRNAVEQLGGQVSAEVREARSAKTKARQEHRDAVDALGDAKQELVDWKEDKLLTVDDFMEHGKSCIKPGFDYFHAKFLSPQGPYFEVMQAYRDATFFNPMDMKGKNVAELE